MIRSYCITASVCQFWITCKTTGLVAKGSTMFQLFTCESGLHKKTTSSSLLFLIFYLSPFQCPQGNIRNDHPEDKTLKSRKVCVCVCICVSTCNELHMYVAKPRLMKPSLLFIFPWLCCAGCRCTCVYMHTLTHMRMHMHTSSVSNDHFLSYRIVLKPLERSLDEKATEGKRPVLQCTFQASFSVKWFGGSEKGGYIILTNCIKMKKKKK